jgi:hypothetical protein
MTHASVFLTQLLGRSPSQDSYLHSLGSITDPSSAPEEEGKQQHPAGWRRLGQLVCHGQLTCHNHAAGTLSTLAMGTSLRTCPGTAAWTKCSLTSMCLAVSLPPTETPDHCQAGTPHTYDYAHTQGGRSLLAGAGAGWGNPRLKRGEGVQCAPCSDSDLRHARPCRTFS